MSMKYEVKRSAEDEWIRSSLIDVEEVIEPDSVAVLNYNLYILIIY